MYIVSKKGVKKDGKYIIPCNFDDIKPAIVDGKGSDEIYITIDDDLFGIAKIVDLSENKVEYIKNEFSFIDEFKNGVAIYSTYCDRFGTKFGLINIDFVELVECVYDRIYWLSDTLLAMQHKGKYGIYSIDEAKFIVPCEYDEVKFSITDGTKQIILEI